MTKLKHIQEEIKKTIVELKKALQSTNKKQDDDVVYVKVYNEYETQFVERLIEKQSQLLANIHNIDKHMTLQDSNRLRWEDYSEGLQKINHKEYNIEMLKEIALAELFKDYRPPEIDELIEKYGQL